MKHVRLATLFAASLALFGACADTEGRAVRLRFRFEAQAEEGQPLGTFDTTTGWRVVLTEARVALGPVYAMRGETKTARATNALRALASSLGPAIARAHGGVDPLSGRAILAQALEQRALDALDATPIETDPLLGTHGYAESITVALEPPSAAIADALFGHHAYVEGTATKDEVTIPFAGGIDLPDSGTIRRVEGIPLAATLDDDGVIVVALRPSAWLAGAHFDRLGPADEAGVHPIVGGEQVAGALTIGLRSRDAYAVRYEEAPP